ncbi:MAG: hypothetical protein RLY93_07465 [Sumerlaeia bacterium]
MTNRPLLTAFEPFGLHAANTSLEVLRAVAALGVARTLALPVLYEEAPRLVIETAKRELPREILMLGMAAGRQMVAVENIARNEVTSGAPDNGGRARIGDWLRPGGPDTLTSPYPRPALIQFLRQRGFASALSDDAGGYVCNATYYGVAHWLWRESVNVPAVFVHIPGADRWDSNAVETFAAALAEWLARSAHR